MSDLSLSLINTYHTYTYPMTYPVVSRIVVLVCFSINTISYQYMSLLDLPYGKNINNDTWNTLG
jgi:hypothetical protein